MESPAAIIEQPPPIIEVQELTKIFGKFTAVDHLSFMVGKGEIFGFLGPNGAGKSTTIRMLCGLLSSTSGSAVVGGYNINKEPEMVRQNIGYMSQTFSLYKDLTVRENLAFFGGVYGLRNSRLRERMDSALQMTGLKGCENSLAGTLSGALQQRLALGCAVLHEPPILFLDEPTSGIDPISRRMFWDLIQDLASRSITILITTHFLDEAEFCGRLGFINQGRLVALNTPSKIRSHSIDEDLFELEAGDLKNAREQTATLEAVVAVSYFGSRLHLFSNKGAYTAESLSNRVKELGLPVISVTNIPPRLEDVFIRLAEKQTKKT